MTDPAARRQAELAAAQSVPYPTLSKPTKLDPWAHRRGEPRLFAVLWMIYVICAIVGSMGWGASGEISLDAYAPAARTQLIVLAAGAFVLWPMTRLCQISPKGSVGGAVLADSVIILLPVWSVVWPLIFVGGWPVDVVAGLAVMFAAWTYTVGGVLTLALMPSARVRGGGVDALARAAWMVAILFVSTGGMAVWWAMGLRGEGGEAAREWAMLSPFSAISTMAGHGFTGPEFAVTSQQWIVTLGVGVVGLAIWTLAGLLARKGGANGVGADEDFATMHIQN